MKLFLLLLLALFGVSAEPISMSTTCIYNTCDTGMTTSCKYHFFTCWYTIRIGSMTVPELSTTFVCEFFQKNGLPTIPPKKVEACSNGVCIHRIISQPKSDCQYREGGWDVTVEFADKAKSYRIKEGAAGPGKLVGISDGGKDLMYWQQSYYGGMQGDFPVTFQCYVSPSGNDNGVCCYDNNSCKSRYCSGNVCQALCGRGDKRGEEGSCCTTIRDCYNGCYNNKCTSKYCLGSHWGTRSGKGGGDDCCRDSDDCDDSCKNGICTPKHSCDRKLGREDGELGDCCESSADCAITCDSSTGKCRNSLVNCPSMTRNAGSCCKVNSDCKSGRCPLGKCVGDAVITTRPGPIPTGSSGCILGWCNKRNGLGPVGACCSTEADCDDDCNGNGKCGPSDGTWKTPLGCANPGSTTSTTTATSTSTPIGKTCQKGYYGKGLKNGPDTYCCATTNDCIGSCTFVLGDSYMCTGGSTSTITKTSVTNASPTAPITTSVPWPPKEVFPPGCVSGFEYSEDHESPDGYCCSQYAAACQGQCVGNVCDGALPMMCLICVPGFNGTQNYNLPGGYCCNDSNDCLGSCESGSCGSPRSPICYRSTTTTTTTTSRSTQSGEKPNPTSFPVKDIVVPCKGGKCIILPIPFPGPLPILGGILGGIFGFLGDHDDEKSASSSAFVTTFTMPPIFTVPVTVPGTKSTTLSSISPTPVATTSIARITTVSTIVPTPSVQCIDTLGCPLFMVCIGGFCVIPIATNTTLVTAPTMNVTSAFVSVPTSLMTTKSSTVSVDVPTSVISMNTSVIPTVTSTSVDATSMYVTTSSVASMTSTSVTPTTKYCKSGYYSKGLRNAPDEYCCKDTKDCIGTCVKGICTSGATVIPTPTPSGCIVGWCGRRDGLGPVGACCSTEADCDDTCNADGKCGVSDETWKKPLPC